MKIDTKKYNQEFLGSGFQRRLTDAEKQAIMIEIEKSKISREKASVIMNRGFILYFSFLIIGFTAYINDYITRDVLNLLVLGGFIVLIIGAVPYMQGMRKAEKALDDLLKYIFNK